MGVFHTKKVLYGNSSLIPIVTEKIKSEFVNLGYEVQIDDLLSGGTDISVTKGGLFKAILGMRTALKISLIPQNTCISFNASVGIFGQQAIPTIISMFFFWPILLTQIWGMIKQSKLDDKALEIAELIIYSHMNNRTDSKTTTYCTHCGKEIPDSVPFCPYCGMRLQNNSRYRNNVNSI